MHRSGISCSHWYLPSIDLRLKIGHLLNCFYFQLLPLLLQRLKYVIKSATSSCETHRRVQSVSQVWTKARSDRRRAADFKLQTCDRHGNQLEWVFRPALCEFEVNSQRLISCLFLPLFLLVFSTLVCVTYFSFWETAVDLQAYRVDRSFPSADCTVCQDQCRAGTGPGESPVRTLQGKKGRKEMRLVRGSLTLTCASLLWIRIRELGNPSWFNLYITQVECNSSLI